MRRRALLHLVIAAFFLVQLSISSHSANTEGLPGLVKAIGKSVISINTFDINGKQIASGTGFFVSESGDVITNRHVLFGAGSAQVKTSVGKIYSVEKVLSEDSDRDIIRLSVRIPRESVQALRIGPSLPAIGERVVVIGSPLGLEQTVSDGIVSSIRNISGFGKIIQLTAPISSGSSGSPVVDLKGNVVGVATFQATKGQNLNFAVPASNIKSMREGAGETIPEWEARRASTQAEGGKDGRGDNTGERNYDLSEGFRSLKWGTQLPDAKRIYPDLLFIEKLGGKLGGMEREYHYFRRKKDNNRFSGVEWDRIRYIFSKGTKGTTFYGAKSESRYEPEEKDSAVAHYNDLYAKITAKYGKPFHQEKTDKKGYPYVSYSIWRIGGESVSLNLKGQNRHVIYRNNGTESNISMLELSLHISSNKGEGGALDF